MPNRIPTQGIKTPAVRKSPTAQPAVKPQKYWSDGLNESNKIKADNAENKALNKPAKKPQLDEAGTAYYKERKAGLLRQAKESAALDKLMKSRMSKTGYNPGKGN